MVPYSCAMSNRFETVPICVSEEKKVALKKINVLASDIVIFWNKES